MAAEMLNRVLEAEKEAALKENDAISKANEIVKSAKEKSESILNATEKKICDLKLQQAELISAITQKLLKDSENEAEDEALALKFKANSKLSEAVGIVKSIIAD